MPLLGRGTRGAAVGDGWIEDAIRQGGPAEGFGLPPVPRGGLFESCANPGCRSGWLHLWRSRTAPIFEKGWTCSAECTLARMQAAVHRELDGRSARATHRHRVPLGLTMLEKGWISPAQLRKALEAQRASGGLLGQWLVRQKAVSEEMVTRALGLQWRCPVIQLDFHDAAALTPVMPRLFVDAFAALPLRVAGAQVLYLGFEMSLDPVLALAVERMTGLRVECGIVPAKTFRQAHTRMLEARFPAVELVEAVSEPAAALVLARAIEKQKPLASRLVRVHDCLWLRMWSGAQTGPLPELAAVRDVVCSIGAM